MKFLKQVARLFGFNKDSKYVRRHIAETNVRGAVFMAIIIIIIEIWMIFRQTNKYVIPRWTDEKTWFMNIFYYTSGFFLFLFVATSVLVFSICYQRTSMRKKTRLILNLVFSGLVIIQGSLLPLESFSAWDTLNHQLSNSLLIVTYICGLLVGLTILVESLVQYFTNKSHIGFIIGVMAAFAVMCVAFGVKVSYSDFISTTSVLGGDDSNHKEIICFLTMMLFASCLLIWRPYVSIIVNVSVFLIFLNLVKTAPVADVFKFKEGDEINYITFLIAMTLVCFSIYHQRRTEAIKDEELIYLADYDELTGLYNFTHFTHMVDRIWEREGKAVFFINILNFQLYNDQRGFPRGNIFLKDAGHIIKDAFPDGFACRQSDDHYLVFANMEGYEARLDELEQRIMALDAEVAPFIQVGIYAPRDGEDSRRAADKARYAANTLGGDLTRRRAVYDTEMGRDFHLKQHVIHNIDNAVAERWIRPYYQPVVWSKTGELCGVEALARWHDPRYGLLPPGKFVPTLEATKLVHKLDACVLESVCRNIRYCLDKGYQVLPVSINFSRLDFELMDIVSYLEEVVAQYDIPKQYLHVEITESALTEDEGLLSRNVKRLKELGYALWLDDFGSGYSSLNVLKDYDFDVMKIDMKFLSGFEGNPKAESLLSSVISMAEKMGMRTLAEGVETVPEKDFLAKSRCERLQGYLFGKAIPFEELEERIEKGELKVSKNLF